MKIILASASPRRKELLGVFIKKFDIVSPCVDETFLNNESSLEGVRRIASLKADSIYASFSDSVVIAADTIVLKDGKAFGKPLNKKEAEHFLKILNGSSHNVVTAVSVRSVMVNLDFIEMTKVTFRNSSDEVIRWYVATEEPFDKAGAYGIQGKGAILVESIDGDYNNVVGLPVSLLINKMVENDILSFEEI